MRSLFQIRFLLLLLLVLAGLTTRAQNVSLTVISNLEGAPAQLKKSELKVIFLGERERWNNGNKIRIAFMKPGTPSGKNICKKIYDMSADDFAHYWEEQAFAGKVERPVYFKNAADLQAYVADNPGAIGIIDQAPTASNTQVVLIDGKRSF